MTLQEHIDEIMDYFDFETVQRAMKAVGWKWSMNGESRVPDVPELRRFARRLIKNTWERAMRDQCDKFTSSGGFEVHVRKYDDGEIGVRLTFVLEEYETTYNPECMITLNQTEE